MCYTGQCSYESFNPMTGDCSCRKKSGPCPYETEECKDCAEVMHEEDLNDDGRCEDCAEAYEEYLKPTPFDKFKCLVCGKEQLMGHLEPGFKCPDCGGSTYNTEDE